MTPLFSREPIGKMTPHPKFKPFVFFSVADGTVKHSRPLPDIPPDESGSGGGIRDGSAGGGFSLEGSVRWTSRENLLMAANDEDPQLFVALYDFQSGGENQLSLKKGSGLDSKIRPCPVSHFGIRLFLQPNKSGF